MTSAQTAQPLSFVTVTIFDAASQYVGHTAVDGQSEYRLGGLNAGEPLVDQVHEDMACPAGPAFLGLCAIENGNAVQRTADGPAMVVDFALRQQQIFVDGFETGDTTAWSSSTPEP